jgi:hypothetical protein
MKEDIKNNNKEKSVSVVSDSAAETSMDWFAEKKFYGEVTKIKKGYYLKSFDVDSDAENIVTSFKDNMPKYNNRNCRVGKVFAFGTSDYDKHFLNTNKI